MKTESSSIFDLSPTPEAVPVHDWQKEELARRWANLMKNPASGLSWEEIKRRVRSRFGRCRSRIRE
jgi:putative addiction module component (TIGR02574 family)